MQRIGAVLLAAAVLALGVADGANGTAKSRTRGRPHTIAFTKQRLYSLSADGRRLAWWSLTGRHVMIFDRVTHRTTVVARSDGCTDPLDMVRPLLAGKRVVWACLGGGNIDLNGAVITAALGDRGGRELAGFEIGYDPEEPLDIGGLYGNPVRIGAGGGTLVYAGYDNDNPDGVWRVKGGRGVRLQRDPPYLTDVTAFGNRIATLDWPSHCGCYPDPVWSPDGKEIAWNYSGTIWRMNAEGSRQRPLSTPGAAARLGGPRWSPSGSTLAFVGNGAVRLIDRDGKNQRKLVVGGNPAWSPDGGKVAFVRSNDLWIVNADGSGERRLTSDAIKMGRSRVGWSPDGSSLVAERGGDIYIVDAASGAARDLTPGGSTDFDPVWSPDGSLIAFERFDSGLYLVRPDGSELQKLSEGDTYRPAWSPDGTRIAFAINVYASSDCYPCTDLHEIRIIRADGTGEKTLRSTPRGVGAPAWSPTGKAIVTDNGESGIYSLDTARGTAKHLVFSSVTSAVEVRSSRNGRLVRRWVVPSLSVFDRRGPDGWVSISGRYVVAAMWDRQHYVLSRFDVRTGTVLGTKRISMYTEPIPLAGRWGVYSARGTIRLFDAKTGRSSPLVATNSLEAGPVITGKRVFWAEGDGKGSRVRELVLR
jgi:Tol biopolymer transport system component